jgi:NAD kinase
MAGVPRVIVVTRKTDYELLLERHGTHAQAAFFLRMREQHIDTVKGRHDAFGVELGRVLGAIPRAWRRARVSRDDLSRFLFEPSDIVVALGQDGLVANLAKYLDRQRVLGINPEPDRNLGVLVPCRSEDAEALLLATAADDVAIEARTMVEARLDDGQRLVALNELFVGHVTHQSARYRIRLGEREEAQSSSGVVITTGTGATGWAQSIHRGRITDVALPTPEEARLAFFVREAYPSQATGTSVTDGELGPDRELEIVSRMNAGGVIFGDGIEDDRLAFHWGSRATLRIASQRLHLVRA